MVSQLRGVCNRRSVVLLHGASSAADASVGIDILADRLFGPQPQAATYVCFWELNLGAVKGLLSAPQGRTLQSAIDSFTMNFKDPINAPAAEFALPLDPDGRHCPALAADVILTKTYKM